MGTLLSSTSRDQDPISRGWHLAIVTTRLRFKIIIGRWTARGACLCNHEMLLESLFVLVVSVLPLQEFHRVPVSHPCSSISSALQGACEFWSNESRIPAQHFAPDIPRLLQLLLTILCNLWLLQDRGFPWLHQIPVKTSNSTAIRPPNCSTPGSSKIVQSLCSCPSGIHDATFELDTSPSASPIWIECFQVKRLCGFQK